MQRLVIHPRDGTTTFLRDIYAGRDDTTVITGGANKETIRQAINDADQVLMMGHGTPYGLMSVGRFDVPGNVIDDETADLLLAKDNSVFIWCHASDYVDEHGLKGFTTGMFVSEIGEASLCGLPLATQEMINESNELFADVVSRFLDQEPKVLMAAVQREYGELAKTNPVAAYNLKLMKVGDGVAKPKPISTVGAYAANSGHRAPTFPTAGRRFGNSRTISLGKPKVEPQPVARWNGKSLWDDDEDDVIDARDFLSDEEVAELESMGYGHFASRS